MSVSTRKIHLTCAVVALNIACLFLGFSWFSLNPPPKIRIPTKRFWQKDVISQSFWNREQQRLDFIHNPIFNSSLTAIPKLPDWLNDTGLQSSPCQPDTRVQRQIPDYNLLPNLFQDFLLYSHCKSYPMLINQPWICEDAPFLLLAVKTLVPHFERRQAIRETWGKVGEVANRSVVTVFLLGNAGAEDHFPNLTALLRHEAHAHRDVLQWDYRDTFLNLTLKDVLFLDWFSSFCSEAQFILKGDDDVFVNTPHIIHFLENLSPHKVPDFFTGDVITDAAPHRNNRLKYFVPESYFTGRYPPYAGGGGFLYSGRLALKLREASKKLIPFPIDDVFTGMCLRKVGLVPEKHPGFRTFGLNTENKDGPCLYRSLMVVHGRTPQEIKHMWTWTRELDFDCQ